MGIVGSTFTAAEGVGAHDGFGLRAAASGASAAPVTAPLKAEHVLIGRVLDGLESLVDRPTVPVSLIAATMDAVSALADGCHHSKEEGLFHALRAHGLPLGRGLLAEMNADHEEGRRLVRAVRATSAAQGASAEVAALVRDYTTLLRHHVAKEDAELFPLAERILSADDKAEVVKQFAEVDNREGGAGMQAAMAQLAEALAHEAETASHGGPAPGGAPVACARDVMRPDVPALRPEMSLTYAAEVMEPLGVRELPVVEQGRLVGILAERDLRPHLGHHEWTAVRTAMTRDPIVVSPETPVPAVARLLLRHGFNGVPVVRDGKLLGMVARVDLLRVLARDGGS
jgi:CBS domain-containing protein/hemerythrin-like domain-containing protein